MIGALKQGIDWRASIPCGKAGRLLDLPGNIKDHAAETCCIEKEDP